MYGATVVDGYEMAFIWVYAKMVYVDKKDVKMKKIFWGIAFIAVGVLVALRAFDVLDFNIFFDGWWTLFIIIPALIGLCTEKKKLGPIIWLLIGILLLLSTNGLLPADTVGRLIVPAVLVLIGAKIIIGDSIKEKSLPKDAKVTEDEKYYAAFSGKKINYAEKEAKNIEINATFGGIQLDLRNAKIADDLVVKVSCVFGGIDILLPENVKLVDKTSAMFGGVDSKKFVSHADENCKTVYLTGNCLFGGVEVK